MPVQVIMPQLGESVVEGTVTKWLKAKGEQVEEYEPLLEINTDKVDSEIPSPASGTLLDILVSEGSTVQAGTLLAWIGDTKESMPEQSQPPEKHATAPAPGGTSGRVPSVSAQPERELGFISPVVARIAGEHKVDLFQVTGTGQGGRITKNDVLAYIELRGQSAAEPAAPAPAQAVSVAAPTPAKSAPSVPSPAPVQPAIEQVSKEGQIVPLTAVRRLIAEHMVLSKHTSPHVTTIMETDLSRIIAHRGANKDAFSRDGVNLTFTAYFISAAVTALKTYPMVNSSWTEEGILLHPKVNIGMATSLGDEGLIVPVIKGAENLSLFGLAKTINDLANRARAHKLQPDEVKGGTFTITNHGISGSLFASPIINQPQCAILGVGAIQKRVVVISDDRLGDTIAIRPMVYLGLTFDHRILDGATADYFLAKVVESLENWS